MQVDFYGYAGDCTVTGRIDLGGARLTDALEHAPEVVVSNAVLLGLAGEPPKRVERLPLVRDDLYAVEAVGGPGDAARRIHTVRHVVRFHCGPYTIRGELHARPGSPPLSGLVTRRSMVPLTAASISFLRAGQPEVRNAPVLIVNGWLIDSADVVGFGDPDAGIATDLPGA